jgi:hypothetical protein
MMTNSDKVCNFMVPIVVYPVEGEVEALANTGTQIRQV